MVNSEELIGTTEHLTLYRRYRINRCRCNRVRLYLVSDICKFNMTWRKGAAFFFFLDLQPLHLCWFLPHQLWLLPSVLQQSRTVTGRQANGCYILYDTKIIPKFGSDVTLRDCIREAPGSNLSRDIKYPAVFRVFSSGSPDEFQECSLNCTITSKFHNISNSLSSTHTPLGKRDTVVSTVLRERSGVRIPADTRYYFLLRIFQTFHLWGPATPPPHPSSLVL